MILSALCMVAWLSAAAPAPQFSDPYAAYQEQSYEQALQGFLAMQLDHPKDLSVLMNVGSAHYQLGQYDLAEKAFRQAAAAPEPQAREQALYNLGNTAFKQGKLDDAMAQYQAALSLNPNDTDARANLAFTRQQQQTRKEQAQRQAQRDAQQQQKPGDPSPGGDPGPKDKDKGTAAPQKESGAAGKQAAKAPPPSPAQQSPPGQQAKGAGAKGDRGAAGSTAARPGDASKQQAERLLDSLNEGRPKRHADDSRRPRGGKDW
jgi:Ca-activated chloride channel family protein